MKWLPALVWIVVICCLSFGSLESLQVPKFFSADKLAHIFMYFVLGMFLYIPLKENAERYLFFMALAVVLAILTELVQHFWITNRFGELGDFLANCVGLLLALKLKTKLQKT